jgi:hypothetical protein
VKTYVVKETISRQRLREIAREGFGDRVKAVVDVEQKIMTVGSELHSDGEVELIENHGSKREYTWGINILPEKSDSEWIEFDSLINLKPAHGNRTRDIEDESVKEKIRSIVEKLIQ